MAIRAKITCRERSARPIYAAGGVTAEVWNGRCDRSFTFAAVYSDDPNAENKAFWDATPSFELKMTVNNAGVDFEVGREYYVDFVKVIAAPAN